MEKNILIIDDEQNLTFFLKEGLKKEGYTVHLADTLLKGREKIKTIFPDLLLLDLNLPDGNGLELYNQLKKDQEFIPTIVLTAHSSIQSAIDAMKLGVDDYITKPFDMKELTILIESLLNRYHIKNQLNYYRRKAQGNQDFEFFVSRLPVMHEIQKMAMKIAEVPVSTVLIEGATGTGKEMLARYIHNNSSQADAPFIEINCASLPENLLESELFGFEPGAFTDAKRRKIGLIELADGGTLFLDEIAEMSLALQAKLLRFLENHSFKRLGGITDIKVEIRVITATNKDIEKLVQEKKFREDLYFRLNVFRLKLPTLAERKEELLILAQFFLEKLNARMNRKIRYISPSCKDIFIGYDWPGNLRELHNVIERSVILSNAESIEPEHLPREISANIKDGSSNTLNISDLKDKSLKDFLNDLESRFLRQAMELSDWNQVKAAKLLNEPRHIIRYLLKKHNMIMDNNEHL